MSYQYRPRGMPRRFMEKAPDIVKRGVIDLIQIRPAAPLDFDVVLREVAGGDMVLIDFGIDGSMGCHAFLKPHEMRAYRARNRRNRIAWHDMPEATRNAIVAYLEWSPA